MRLIQFDELDEYLPRGHDGVVNRLMVGRAQGGEDSVSVWHGRLEPGGQSDLHVHESSLQIYIGLVGELTIGDGQEEGRLGELSTAIIERGALHSIANRSEEAAEVLVISVPALR